MTALEAEFSKQFFAGDASIGTATVLLDTGTRKLLQSTTLLKLKIDLQSAAATLPTSAVQLQPAVATVLSQPQFNVPVSNWVVEPFWSFPFMSPTPTGPSELLLQPNMGVE